MQGISREDIERQALERLGDFIALDDATRDLELGRLHTESPEVAAAVRALLAHADASDLQPRSAGAASSESGQGELIGAWRLGERLGHGGMGEVHVAERADGAYQQRAAIKRVWAGVGALDERFRRERQVLARLQHAHIARLLDGGVTAQGHPWFAMELVEGETITHWCDGHRWSLRQRVALFRQACDAIAFAHRNLVVHRDIKPGNVLVDGDGNVKLLDFGIAKLLDNADPEQTQTLALTPAWAAPEQARGEAVTTASDVYQLGLLLRVLLCGRVANAASRGRPMSAELRALRNDDPDALRELARMRDTGAEGLITQLRGDLDAIVLRATADAPGDRYSSVDALSDDLARWLEHRPLQGARESWWSRGVKFVRRNRVAAMVSALALIVVAVAGGYAIQKRQQQRREARMSNMSIVLADHLLNMLEPDRLQGRKLSAEQLLDGAVAAMPELRRSNPDDPVAAAALQSLVANKYMAFGRYDKALPLLQDSLRGLRAERDRFPDIWAKTVNYTAFSLMETRKPDQARALVEEELAHRAKDAGADPVQTAALWRTEAQLLSQAGAHDRADAALQQGLQALSGQTSDQALQQHADLMCQRGLQSSVARRDAQAEQALLACLAERKRLPATVQSTTNDLVALGTLADVYNRSHRQAQAEIADFQAMEGLERQVGAIHPRTSLFRLKWATLAAANGHPEQAIARLQSSQVAMSGPGADPQRRAREAVVLAQAQLVAFRPADALATLATAHAPLMDVAGVNPEFRWQYQQAWADALYEGGRWQEAKQAFAESRAMAAAMQEKATVAPDREVWRARQASDGSQIALCEWMSGERDAAVADAAKAWLAARDAHTATQRIQQRSRIHWRWMVAMLRPSQQSFDALSALRAASPEMIQGDAHPNAWRFDRMLDAAAHVAGITTLPAARLQAADIGIAHLAAVPDPTIAPGLSVF